MNLKTNKNMKERKQNALKRERNNQKSKKKKERKNETIK